MAITDQSAGLPIKWPSELPQEQQQDCIGPVADGNLRMMSHRTTGKPGLLAESADSTVDSVRNVLPPSISHTRSPLSAPIICDSKRRSLDVTEETAVAERFRYATFPVESDPDDKDSVPSSPIVPPSALPVNFGQVVPGVYRSSYPRPFHHDFIKGLDLKCIISLAQPDETDTELDAFITANGIRHHVINIRGTKKESIPLSTIKVILKVVLDQQNHPLLLHCNHGKHRTGCVVAVVRKISGWKLPDIIDEYRSYAKTKVRPCDIAYISAFRASDLSPKLSLAVDLPFLRARVFFRALLLSVLFTTMLLISISRIKSNPRDSAESKG